MQRWPVLTPFLLLLLVLATPAAWGGARAVYSPDGTDVWAVGTQGQVFRSLDGGQTFFAGLLGDKTLNGVAVRGLTALVVGDSGKVWRSVNAGGAWDVQVPDGAGDLYAVAMPSASIAYAAGAGGRILKSADGGASWTPQNSGVGVALRRLACLSEDDVWAVGDGGAVLRTTNGGSSWTPVDAGTANDLLGVDARGSTVWVVGRLGTARRSVNGGASFDPVNLRLDAGSEVRAVHLASADSVILSGGGGFVRISADGGATWDFPQHRLHGSVGGMHFAGPVGFVASGDTMIVIRTADGGATWALPPGTTVTHPYVFKFDAGSQSSKRGNTFAINAQNPRTLYCMLVNQVYVSRDLGETWTPTGVQVSGATKTNAFIVSPRDSNLWVAAVTDPDRIVRSTNGGATWSTTLTRNFGEYGIPVEMDPDRPDTLYFGPDNSELYRSTDFGQSWSVWSTTVFRSPCDIVVVPGSDSLVIYVGDGVTNVGLGELWRSAGGDPKFTLQHTGATGSSEIPTISVSRLEPKRAFLTSWSGPDPRVTNDYGLTWEEIPPLSTVQSTWGTDVARDDPNVVTINRYGGQLSYLSADGGANWSTSSKVGANYAMFMPHRGLIFSLTSTGIYRLRTHYAFAPAGPQSLALTAPAGGEVWAAGSGQTIAWNAANVAMAMIEYRTSPADPWIEVATVPGYAGTYDWTVPDDPTFTAEVRVRDGWDGAPADASAPFTIAAPRIAADPEALDFGEVAVGGDAVRVITIENPGTAALEVTAAATQSLFFTPGRTTFSVPAGGADTLSLTFAPAAAEAYVDTLDLTSGAADGPLRVPLAGTGTQVMALGLIAPDGGEVWQYGVVQRIEWQSVLVDSVRIELRQNDGAPWATLVEAFPADSGGYWWVIPDFESELARVRVSEIGGAIETSSAGPFSVRVPRLAATPLSADLGLVALGYGRPVKISLGNAGSAPLEISSISSDDPDFVPDASSMAIGAGGLDSLIVTFTPMVEGSDTATVTLVHNGPGSSLAITITGEGTSNVSVEGERPLAFAIEQNRPNPFAGVTMIRYALPVRAPVILDVYDLQGQRIATLVEGVQEPGVYTVPFGPGVQAADGRLRDVRAGVYFYRLRAGAFTATRKMLLLR